MGTVWDVEVCAEAKLMLLMGGSGCDRHLPIDSGTGWDSKLTNRAERKARSGINALP